MSSARAFLDRQIEFAAGGNTEMTKNYLATATAAKAMLGTGKPAALRASSDLDELKHALGAAYGGYRSARVLGNILSLEDAEVSNRPLGMPADMWPKIKSMAQSALANLHAQGFTNEDIAAILFFDDIL